MKKSKAKAEENKEDIVKKVKKRSKEFVKDQHESGSPQKKAKKKKKPEEEAEDETYSGHSSGKKAKVNPLPKSTIPSTKSPKFSLMTESQRQKLSEYLRGPQNNKDEKEEKKSDPGYMSAFQEAFMKTLLPENDDHKKRSKIWNKIKHSQTLSKSENFSHDKETGQAPEESREYSYKISRPLLHLERSMSPPLLPLSEPEECKVKTESPSSLQPISVNTSALIEAKTDSTLPILMPNFSQEQSRDLSPPILSPHQLVVKSEKEDRSPPVLTPSKPIVEAILEPKLHDSPLNSSSNETLPNHCHLQTHQNQPPNMRLSQCMTSLTNGEFFKTTVTSVRPSQSFYQVLTNEQVNKKRTQELVTINQGITSGGTVLCTEDIAVPVHEKICPEHLTSQTHHIQSSQNLQNKSCVFQQTQSTGLFNQNSQKGKALQADRAGFSVLTIPQKPPFSKPEAKTITKSLLGEKKLTIQYLSQTPMIVFPGSGLQPKNVSKGIQSHQFTTATATTTTTSICQTPLCLTRPATQSVISTTRKSPVSALIYPRACTFNTSTEDNLFQQQKPSTTSLKDPKVFCTQRLFMDSNNVRNNAQSHASGTAQVIQNVTVPSQIFGNIGYSKVKTQTKINASPLLIQHLQQQVSQSTGTQCSLSQNQHGITVTNTSLQPQPMKEQRLFIQPVSNNIQHQQVAICSLQQQTSLNGQPRYGFCTMTPSQVLDTGTEIGNKNPKTQFKSVKARTYDCIANKKPRLMYLPSGSTPSVFTVTAASSISNMSNASHHLSNGQQVSNAVMHCNTTYSAKNTPQIENNLRPSCAFPVSQNSVSTRSISPPSLECIKSDVNQHVWSRPPSLSPKPTEHQPVVHQTSISLNANTVSSLSEDVYEQSDSKPSSVSLDKGSGLFLKSPVIACDNKRMFSVQGDTLAHERGTSSSLITSLHNPRIQESLTKLIVSGDLRLFPDLLKQERPTSALDQTPEQNLALTQAETNSNHSQPRQQKAIPKQVKNAVSG